MSSFFSEGSKINFNGIKGNVIKITETYRKNVLVVKIIECPGRFSRHLSTGITIGLFEFPDGTLEFMSIIE